MALIELDGVAGRIIICPPDLPSDYLPTVIAKGEVDAIVSDTKPSAQGEMGTPTRVICSSEIKPGSGERTEACSTEWVLLTSGTSGAPKMIVHSLESLTNCIHNERKPGVVWGTFYDIRRYGGLQILLRALLGSAPLVLSGPDEPMGDFLLRLGRHGATHISGTPSHWRRVLMSPYARAIEPHYVRLSGEIVDQGILNALKAFYPQAAISHAFASTEAGVGFEVTDGLEGFPASMVGARGGLEISVENGSLRIRSERTASRVLGGENGWLDADGFVDTGDLVELRGDRYYFLGRRSGVINVGGLKVHPEEIETVINRHPAVRMSRVRARRNSITGSLVEADVVLAEGSAGPSIAEYKREILQICRKHLATHKVPATVRCVAALEFTAAGKLARNYE
jgi:acyl-coenzyme A synthetase/AMP-(fatty) acid ligase